MLSLISVITLVKWFDKKWVSFYVPLLMTAETLEWAVYNVFGMICDGEKTCWHRTNVEVGYFACLMTFIICVLIYNFLPTDPLDSNLLINEQAVFLSTRYTSSLQKIMNIQSFRD